MAFTIKNVVIVILLVCVGHANAQSLIFSESTSTAPGGEYRREVLPRTATATPLVRLEITTTGQALSGGETLTVALLDSSGFVYYTKVDPSASGGNIYIVDLSGVVLPPPAGLDMVLRSSTGGSTITEVQLYGAQGSTAAPAPVVPVAPSPTAITPTSTGTATATPLNTFVSQIIPAAGTPAQHTVTPAGTTSDTATEPEVKSSTHQHISALDTISANADISRTIALGHTGHIDQRLYALRNRSVRAIAEGTGGIGLDVWTMGNYSLMNQDATGVLHGYDSDASTGTLGIEYMFNPAFSFGISLGESSSDIEYDSDGGDIDSKGEHYSLYSHYSKGRLYGSILYSYGDLDVDIRRSAGYFGQADATTRAKTHTVEGSIAYDFTHKHLSSGPVLQMRYDWVGVDGYREENAGLANLQAQSLDSEIWGASLGWAVRYDGSDLSPFLIASYEYEETSSDELSVASAADGSISLTHEVPGENVDYATLKAGLIAYITEALHTQASYETMFFHDGVDYHSMNISLSFSF